jgi:hypothetical protein
VSEVSLTNEVPEGHVGIRIDENLARLALIAADGLQRMSGAELMKLQSMLKANFGKVKPTAKNVSDMFRLVGFTFSQALHEAREKRIEEGKEQADASDNSEAS